MAFVVWEGGGRSAELHQPLLVHGGRVGGVSARCIATLWGWGQQAIEGRPGPSTDLLPAFLSSGSHLPSLGGWLLFARSACSVYFVTAFGG